MYIARETSKLIKKKLIEVHPQYKFSVKIQDSALLIVTLKSGDLNLLPHHGQVRKNHYKKNFSAEKEIIGLISSIYETIFETHPQTDAQVKKYGYRDYVDLYDYGLILQIDNNYIQK